MSLVSIVGSASTVLAVLTFAAIVVWAYGSGRKRAFEEAANAPFALADEDVELRGASGDAAENGS